MQLVSETLLEWHAHRRKRMSESRRHTVKRARHNWNECLSFSISWVQLEEQACFLIYSRDMWTGKTVCHIIPWKLLSSYYVYSDFFVGKMTSALLFTVTCTHPSWCNLWPPLWGKNSCCTGAISPVGSPVMFLVPGTLWERHGRGTGGEKFI